MTAQSSVIILLVILLLCSCCPASSSTSDVFEDETTGETIVTVVSGRVETTFQGASGVNMNRGWGLMTTIRYQFASGEEFCIYIPVLGMRNFTTFFHATKYWDSDAEFEMHDSEGVLIQSQKLEAIGKRVPFAKLEYINIPRTDVLQICARNTGSTKTMSISIHMNQKKTFENYISLMSNLSTAYNVSFEALARVESKVANIATYSMIDRDTAIQDYYRLVNIAKWVQYRGVLGSLAMLFCTSMSTLVIRRWFVSPRASV